MCLENRAKFDNVRLYTRRNGHCVELINKDLPWQLNKTVEAFLYFSIALCDSTDTSHTAHLYSSKVWMAIKLLYMKAVKKKATGETCMQHVSRSQNIIWSDHRWVT
jgi:hypothetical protein